VDDSIGRVGVQPIETAGHQGPPHVARHRHGLAPVEQRNVLMDVKDGALHLIAAYTVDRLSGGRVGLRRRPKPTDDERYDERIRTAPAPKRAERRLQQEAPSCEYAVEFGE